VRTPTVIAVDWSGAKRPKGIWIAVVRDGAVVESRPLTTREQAIDAVAVTPGPVIAGFDFSFSVPQWFAHELSCRTVDDVWRAAERHGERWLAPTPPFWRTRCEVPAARRFRDCETRFPTAKSVFQLVGNGQVGAGSVRGMPLLPRLREAGFAIWPFNAAAERTALEIYPRALRRHISPPRAFESNDERDAVCSALVLWKHRRVLSALPAATDPRSRIEGDLWMPA
jgi:hypothetical protein